MSRHSFLNSDKALDTARGWLAPFAERVLTALEDPSEHATSPPPPPKSLEHELLEGSRPPLRQHRPSPPVSEGEAQQLQRDFGALLAQRAQLRAQLVVEQERRERAEAELVAIGAQWLGTDTQAALRRRAEAERHRALDAEKERIHRDAEERVARAEAEKLMLQKQLAKDAPSALALKMKLRQALSSELAEARAEIQQATALGKQPWPTALVADALAARRAQAVEEQLTRTCNERDQLATAFRQAEAAHVAEKKMLSESLRKASKLLSEQRVESYREGFAAGLAQAAATLTAAQKQTELDVQRAAEAILAPHDVFFEHGTNSLDDGSLMETSSTSGCVHSPMPLVSRHMDVQAHGHSQEEEQSSLMAQPKALTLESASPVVTKPNLGTPSLLPVQSARSLITRPTEKRESKPPADVGETAG